jgi:hypothetical protein
MLARDERPARSPAGSGLPHSTRCQRAVCDTPTTAPRVAPDYVWNLPRTEIGMSRRTLRLGNVRIAKTGDDCVGPVAGQRGQR